jgi:hypothetical protein
MALMRYRNTERLGVNESNNVFTKEINWIFREQPIADFGIDAIIEETRESNPTGRLIAAQIKTGYGNFHITEKSLTFYVSYIHYNYWIGYVLPIIIIGYLPEENLLIWQEISRSTLKKTPNKWKIEIPRNRILDHRSIPELTRILDSRFRRVIVPEALIGDPFSVSIFSLVENIDLINEASNSTIRFIDAMTEIRINSEDLNNRINTYIRRGLTEFDSQVVASINKFAQQLIILASRIENENVIFSKSFGQGVAAYAQISTIYFNLANDKRIQEETNQSFKQILVSLIDAQAGVGYLRNSLSKLPAKYTRLKDARNRITRAIDSLLEEYSNAEQIIKNYIAI